VAAAAATAAAKAEHSTHAQPRCRITAPAAAAVPTLTDLPTSMSASCRLPSQVDDLLQQRQPSAVVMAYGVTNAG
jgi:hypothetical protein